MTWKPEPDEHVGAMVHDWLCQSMAGVMGESVSGMFGYAQGVRFYIPMGGNAVHVGRLDYGGDHHGNRARLDISGVGCGRISNWIAFRDRVEQLEQVKLTRVDIAVDAMEGEFSVEDAVDWYQSGEFNCGGRMPRHSLVGDWLSPKHGRTIEVGRRENGKMLRCYEKGRQLGEQSSPWTRFEVELRNNDRDLPIDILTDCDKYFVGTYKCLERILDSAAERIKTHQKEGEISLEKLITHQKSAYGTLVHVLRASLSAGEVLDAISRPGVPKRLEKSALGGFKPTGPLPDFH